MPLVSHLALGYRLLHLDLDSGVAELELLEVLAEGMEVPLEVVDHLVSSKHF